MKNNKIVYVLVKSVYEDDPWSQILDWECKGDDYKNTIDPLKQFINKWNISGIIITNPPIYVSITSNYKNLNLKFLLNSYININQYIILV